MLPLWLGEVDVNFIFKELFNFLLMGYILAFI